VWREVWLGQVDGEGGGRARSERDERSAQRSVGRSVGNAMLFLLPFSLSPSLPLPPLSLSFLSTQLSSPAPSPTNPI